jgi:hypothetical protein
MHDATVPVIWRMTKQKCNKTRAGSTQYLIPLTARPSRSGELGWLCPICIINKAW